MNVFYNSLFPALWLSWGAYWLISSRNVKATARRESASSRWLHILPLLLAILLIATPSLSLPLLDSRFLPRSASWVAAGALLCAIGLLFTVWARLHLGRNWSGTVTIKEGHELVTSGPYALVRNPIYSGLLLGFIGSALARGQWRGVLAVALVYWAFARKIRLESRWMQERFGAAYEAYRRQVASLVPFLF